MDQSSVCSDLHNNPRIGPKHSENWDEKTEKYQEGVCSTAFVPSRSTVMSSRVVLVVRLADERHEGQREGKDVDG